MQLANNPLLALFTAGGSAAENVFSFQGQGQIQIPEGANAFAALVANVPEATEGQSDIVKALSALLPKLEGIFQKLAPILENATADTEVPEDLVATLGELGAVLAQIDQATEGGLFRALKDGLQVSVPTEQNGAVETPTQAPLDIAELLETDSATPELLAAITEVLTVLRPVIETVVRDVVQSLSKELPQVVSQSATPQLAVVQEVLAKRGQAAPAQSQAAVVATPEVQTNAQPQGQNAAAAPMTPAQIVSQVVTETARIVQALPQSDLPEVANGNAPVLPTADGDALLTQLRELGPQPQNILRALMAVQNNGATPTAFKDLLAQMTAVEMPVEAPSIIAPEAAAISTERTTDLQIQATQQAQGARTPEAANPRFVNAVLQQIKAVDVQEGVTKVELTPRGLGNIELEMKTNSDGSLSVVVRAENAHVLNSLREERDLLAQIVGQAGEGSVEFQDYESDTQHQQGESGGFATGSDEASDGPATVTEALETEATIGGGTLDLMT